MAVDAEERLGDLCYSCARPRNVQPDIFFRGEGESTQKFGKQKKSHR